MGECGEVVCSGKGCYQWTIDDFLSKAFGKTCNMSSPYFLFGGDEYYMNIHINKGENVVRITFYPRCYAPKLRLRVKIGMNTGHKGKIEYRSGETVEDVPFMMRVWMPYSKLIQRRNEILSDGKLTVFCELGSSDTDESPSALQDRPSREEEVQEESDSDDEVTNSESKVFKKLQNDFKNILDSGEDCDVTVKVNGKEFLAHSIILRARSPVFKSMFSHEMVEKLKGVVVIDDCDPETFPDLLNYLYTGSTKHISGKNVCQLYTASSRYQVEELKEECAAYMKSHLSISNFCDILALALRHSEEDLIHVTTELFCSNARIITKTATWQAFLSENWKAGNELFQKYLSREK